MPEASPLEIEAVLDIVLTSAARLLEGEGGSVMLRTGPDELEVVAAPGNPAALGARVKFGDGVAGKVAENCDAVLVTGRAGVRAKPIDSGMSVPLMHQGSLFGVMNVNGGAGRTFNEFDLQAATAFAGHAADALAAARRYEMARQQSDADAERHLTEMLRHLNSAASVNFEELTPLETFDFGTIVRAVAEEESAEGRRTDVRGPLSLWVVGRPARLRRALRELVRNAHAHGEPPVRVVLETGDPAAVTVADAGPGVPEDDRERLFEPFVRLDRAAAVPGLGLGLTIARQAVEACGGSVTITETPVGGGALRIRLRGAR